MNTNRCEYLSSTADSWQCQNSARYKCSHCPSSFCLKHGSKHQKDLREEISRLLVEAKVSHEHVTRERFYFIPKSLKLIKLIYFMKTGRSFVIRNELYISECYTFCHSKMNSLL